MQKYLYVRPDDEQQARMGIVNRGQSKSSMPRPFYGPSYPVKEKDDVVLDGKRISAKMS